MEAVSTFEQTTRLNITEGSPLHGYPPTFDDTLKVPLLSPWNIWKSLMDFACFQANEEQQNVLVTGVLTYVTKTNYIVGVKTKAKQCTRSTVSACLLRTKRI
jgi:hypothetical protein